MSSVIWELESDKVKKALAQGVRLDGRQWDEYRPISIQTDISHNADSSARVKLGETDVIIGLKSFLGEPFPDKPDEGSISVSAEFLPIASSDFEFGPPSSESIETARVVDRGIRESKAVDFKQLAVDEEKVWVLYLDIYTVNHAGNLFDSSAIGCLKALSNARLPKLDKELKPIPYAFDKKLALKRLPLLSTFVKVGSSVVVDPSLAEEKAASCRFSVAVTEDGYLSAFQKGGPGTFSVSEIDACIQAAERRTKEVRAMFFEE